MYVFFPRRYCFPSMGRRDDAIICDILSVEFFLFHLLCLKHHDFLFCLFIFFCFSLSMCISSFKRDIYFFSSFKWLIVFLFLILLLLSFAMYYYVVSLVLLSTITRQWNDEKQNNFEWNIKTPKIINISKHLFTFTEINARTQSHFNVCSIELKIAWVYR